MPRLTQLLTLALLGCSTASGRTPCTWVGKTEADVREAYTSRSTDVGVIYWGGSGRRRLYFALGDGTQVWFELDLAGTVEMVGGPEPKTRWVHYSGDSITVEDDP